MSFGFDVVFVYYRLRRHWLELLDSSLLNLLLLLLNLLVKMTMHYNHLTMNRTFCTKIEELKKENFRRKSRRKSINFALLLNKNLMDDEVLWPLGDTLMNTLLDLLIHCYWMMDEHRDHCMDYKWRSLDRNRTKHQKVRSNLDENDP